MRNRDREIIVGEGLMEDLIEDSLSEKERSISKVLYRGGLNCPQIIEGGLIREMIY